MTTGYERLAAAIRDLIGEGAREASPPVSRGTVVSATPLVVDIDDDVIEEGDPDVEFDRGLLTERPDVGDVVRVHYDGDGWIVAGVLDG